MISRLSTASIAQGFIKSKSILASNTKYNPYWVAIWDSSGSTTRSADSVVVDSSGNPVVLIKTSGTQSEELVSIEPTFAVNNFAKNLVYNDSVQTLGGMTVDTSGNFYTTNGIYNGVTTYDGVINKFNSSGVKQWSVKVGANEYNLINDIDYDTSGGYIYVTGKHSYSGAYHQLIQRFLTSDGSVQATRVYRYTSGSDEEGIGIVCNSSGEVFVTGYSYGFSGSKYDLTIIKYDSSFQLAWQRKFTPAANEYPYAVRNPIIDNNGNLVALGYYYFGGYPKIFLFSISTSGTLNWQRYLTAGSIGDTSRALAKDSSGNIYAIGDYSADLLISKWNDSGTLQWQRKLTTSSGSFSTRNAVVNGNLIYISGIVGSKAFLAKFPTDGSGTGTYVADRTFTYAADSRTATTSTETLSTPSFTSTAITVTSSTNTTTASNSTRTFTLGT